MHAAQAFSRYVGLTTATPQWPECSADQDCKLSSPDESRHFSALNSANDR